MSRITQRRPVATYSIVARDPGTGELGCAVQSHWFSVGSIVTWAESGIGAVCTQSFVEPSYGPKGLELMRSGVAAPDALKRLVAEDAAPHGRQVAMVDAHGRVGVYTGKSAMAAAGHQSGAQYSVQANMMDNPTIWPAMAAAFERASGDLTERLLVALEAAETAGGDIRGRQSAAILVVRPKTSGKAWIDRTFDLRVEDHPTPVAELRRLVHLQRGYLQLNEGDEHLNTGDLAGAMQYYRSALDILADEETNGEAPYWVGITLASQGRFDEAVPYVRRAYKQHAKWAELTVRLPASGLLPDQETAARLVAAMRA